VRRFDGRPAGVGLLRSASAGDTEVIGMTATIHDRIVVESERVGQPAREGEILEVIEASYGTRYRVAWDDGHESTFRPAVGSATILPAAKRSKPAKRP
jgi:hypothetical protein